MIAYYLDWAHLLARWFHVVIGAAWIGASFYFIWLNNHVRPMKDEPNERVAGGLWAVHGGAFYKVTKFKGAPEKLPDTLHWFKWEAYLTWLTGIALLTFVYWMNARTFMIDPQIANLAPWQAVSIGIGSIVGGWLFYDLLCKSPLRKSPNVLALILATFLTASAFVLAHLLSPRAAYIHVGAMMGTMMAANVFFVIIPGQRAMVDAMIAGKEPPVERGAAGSLRSLHNNYLTLPVLFVMVSNHFPMTFGHKWNWILLALISAVGASIRHWINITERGQSNSWMLPAAALGLVAIIFVSRPAPVHVDPDQAPPTMAEVQGIITTRCVSCHAKTPTQAGIAAPPKDVVLETAAQIQARAPQIKAQVVDSKVMPLGNVTQMTDEERQIIATWIASGAPSP